MRFNHLFLASLLLLSGFSSATIQIRTSFGPEVSAEDFKQHVQNLQALAKVPVAASSNQKQRYLQNQFARIGIANQAMNCAATFGVKAQIKGTEIGHQAVVYSANWHQVYEIAAVLEIAERFMTQSPRPKHDVIFVLAEAATLQAPQCDTKQAAHRISVPENLDALNALTLVQALNKLHIAGK